MPFEIEGQQPVRVNDFLNMEPYITALKSLLASYCEEKLVDLRTKVAALQEELLKTSRQQDQLQNQVNELIK